MKDSSVPGVSKDRLKSLPTAPGVYLMKDVDGKVIYIGKAKNLKNRVRSYFTKSDGRYRVHCLRQALTEIDTIVTEDEQQALVLESDLIKKYKPRYNVRLKDDKAHLIVRIDMDQDWPRLELVRRVQDDGARYIGPFAFSYQLRVVLDVIKRSIPLRTCSDRVMHNRVRPCLEYQIKRCAGPCCLDVDRSEYLEWVEQAAQILQGKNSEVVRSLEKQMQYASDELRFEDAAVIRDRIDVLKKVVEEKPAKNFGDGSRDAFALYREGSDVELSVLMVRAGRLFGSKSFGFSDVELPDEELLPSLISQFYEGQDEFVDEIIVGLSLDDADARSSLYSEKRGGQVLVLHPKRGPKVRLLKLAEENARENFQARFGGFSKSDKVLRALERELELEQTPRTIECVDISHFQGGATVGSVVSFQDGRPDRTRYRRFHLSIDGKPDDFACMREVLMRHLSRSTEENTLPDLLVVDGGMGQLSQAVSVRNELSLDQPKMIGLAKKRASSSPIPALDSAGKKKYQLKKPERIYVEGESVPVVLKSDSEALHLLERVRDEAHRFAISFHRKTRSKRVFRSELDRIPGVGVKRRNELLREFRSVQAIREASPEDLQKRCRIPLKLAERIIAALQSSRNLSETDPN